MADDPTHSEFYDASSSELGVMQSESEVENDHTFTTVNVINDN
ncbi:hypothetical protein ACLSY0_02235 [Avibacterium avium]